jgi:hypothetical protein
MTVPPNPGAVPHPYELTRLGLAEWLISDDRFERSDPRCLVACVRNLDEYVDVVWLGETRLPGSFESATHVLSALQQQNAAASRPAHLSGAA